MPKQENSAAFRFVSQSKGDQRTPNLDTNLCVSLWTSMPPDVTRVDAPEGKTILQLMEAGDITIATACYRAR
jgi:hypothetical protein